MAMTRNNKPDSPAYECPAYEKMEEYRTICRDVKEGTLRLREKKQEYLPRFDGEEIRDWNARVRMTFADDYYAQTLDDHVGLIHHKPPKLLDDGDPAFKPFAENVDGKGTHIEVFSEELCRAAMDDGLSFIFTDFPYIPAGRRVTIREAARIGMRPYWRHVFAEDVLNWRFEKVAGVTTLVQVTIREVYEAKDGSYGTKEQYRYRVFTQDVIYATSPEGEPVGIATGEIHWTLYEESSRRGEYSQVGAGELLGQDHIPLRVMYGGHKVDDFVAYPFLYQLALTAVEETQVKSDLRYVMHKCNVPTPIIKGRPSEMQGRPLAMGKAIDVPSDGDAKMLEPTGVALAATRNALLDIQSQLRRQGAVVKGEGLTQTMTATEAAMYQRQRNARLRTAARSEQDCLENALTDVAAYFGLDRERAPSVQVQQDFGSVTLDPVYLALIFNAWQANLLPADAALYALKNGELPDDFNVESAALKAMSQVQLVRDLIAQGQNPLTGQKQIGAGPPDKPGAGEGEGAAAPGAQAA